MHPLDDPLAKLTRADEHLRSLHCAVAEFLATKPYRITLEVDPTQTEKVQWVEFDPAPLVIGVLIGDCVHNLRSSLDHLAWQFASLKGNPGRECQFPLFTSEDDFRTASGQRMIEQVLVPEARQLIEDVQPYNTHTKRWVGVGLVMVQTLSNTDKHRIVLPSVVSARAVGTMSTEVRAIFSPHRGRAKLAVAPATVPDKDMRVEVFPQLIFDQGSDVPFTGNDVIHDLRTCSLAVRTVMDIAAERCIFPPQ